VRHDRLLAVFYWATVAMLMLPLGLIALTSLTDAALVGFPLGRPSLRWYAATVANPANGRAFLLSLVLAAASAGAAAVAGTWIAVAAAMLRPRWRWLLLAGTLLPLVTPGIVHAIALRIAIRSLGLDPGPLAILLGHTIHATPLAAIMVATRLATTQPGVIDAARDLGAGPVRAFLHVQLPWLRPALAGAALLSALNSFDDFIRSFFLGGYETTLPVLIFGRLRSGLTPEINALATLTLLAVAAIALPFIWLARPEKTSGKQP
jgi:spermidine/putrescine transport system permease protein